jgi:hypothetical protein
MKSWSKLSITLAIVLTMIVVSTPVKVNAKILHLPFIPIPYTPEVAPGSWTWTGEASGVEVQPDTLTATPPAWRLIKTNGLVLSGPATMCHEFTGNQNGWMGDIYMLAGDSWTKLVTTVDWVPTIEGHLMACAQAPAAGTYALFAYWDKPEGWQSCKTGFTSIGATSLDPICVFEFDI